MQPVGGGEVTCPPLPGTNAIRVLAYLTYFVVADFYAGLGGRVEKGAMQHGPAYTAPSAPFERRVDVQPAVPIADSPDRFAVRMHFKALQVAQGMRHQPFTAGLVDRSAAPFGDDHFQSGPSAVYCGSQAGRAAADDEKVDHVRPASAAFSILTRVLSSHALSIENTNAVTHAVCTNGSATPSATTAT